MSSEVVEYEGGAMAAHPQQSVSLFRTDDPQEIVARATGVANALAQVIDDRGLFVNIQGRRHVRVEGWTLCGSMLGVFPVCEWSRPIEGGYEARVVARTMGGAIVGAAEASCTRSERTWASRDDFALRSMAQTRATSKAMRIPLGFIVSLAGFEATPAEEMDGLEPTPERHARRAPDKPSAKPGKRQEPAPAASGAISEAMARRIVAIARTVGETHGEHGFHVVASALKQTGLDPFPPKAKMDDALLHLCEHVTSEGYEEFVALVEGWTPEPGSDG